MLSFFPRDVFDEIGDLIESVSEGFPTYSFDIIFIREHQKMRRNSETYFGFSLIDIILE